MKEVIYSIAVALVLVAMAVSPALAASQADEDCPVDECMPWTEALTKMGTVAMKNLSLGVLKTTAQVAWMLDKAALYIFDLVIHGEIWESLRGGVLDALASFMPDVLQDLIGGVDGLLYIALMIAGVSMTIPFVQNRLVNPGQAILWALVLLAVFGPGAMGYDLIGAVERLRVGMMERIISAGGEGDFDAIVTGPMQASGDDLALIPLLALPESFESEYFLEPQGYQTVRTVFVEGSIPISFQAVSDVEIETDDSLEMRRNRAIPGVFIALLSLLGGYAALLFALIFALLMTASLALIIFLFAALPMGLFEFGRTVVAGIFDKYIQIVILSIGAAIFTAVVAQTISLIPTSAATIGDALKQVAILMPILGVEHMFVKWAYQAMMDSRSVFGRSMRAVFSSAGTRPPGALQRGAASTLRTLGTAAAFTMGGPAGVAASLAANVAANVVTPGSRQTQGRGDVFREMQKGASG